MARLVDLSRPLLFAFLTSCHTKRLVCDLIEMYVKTTDNDIDNTISNMVRNALMKNCE